MIKFLPILLIVGYVLLSLRFSLWQTRRTLDQQSQPLQDPALQAVAQRLADALDVPRIEVNLLDIEPVNGLAGPDGKVYLTKGFLAERSAGRVTDEELASVIAHELGHVSLGHMRRRMINFAGQNAVLSVLALLLNRFVPIVGIWIANLLMSALMARLSRQDEFEADAFATALMIRAGFGTAPQKSLFAKLDALTKGRGDGVPVWLRSHPKTEERIAAIETNEARWRQPA